jgi:hypothetical protein
MGLKNGDATITLITTSQNTQKYGDLSKIVERPRWDTAIAKYSVLAPDPTHDDTKACVKGIYNGIAGWVKPVEAMW